MSEIKLYTTDAGRKAAIQDAEARGLTMLQDNFLKDGTKQMIFDIIPPSPPDVRRERLKVLLGLLQAGTMTQAELFEMLKLERGL